MKTGKNIEQYIWQWKHQWIWSCFETRRTILHEITEGRMRGKTTSGRRRIQMLHDLANDVGFVTLKRAAERVMERQRKDVKSLLYSRRLLILNLTMHYYNKIHATLQGCNHGYKVEGDQGLGPNTGALAPRAWPEAGLGVGVGGGRILHSGGFCTH